MFSIPRFPHRLKLRQSTEIQSTVSLEHTKNREIQFARDFTDISSATKERCISGTRWKSIEVDEELSYKYNIHVAKQCTLRMNERGFHVNAHDEFKNRKSSGIFAKICVFNESTSFAQL